MASYAVQGGGVGPHFDSYDVFLLQGFGRRRWRYGRQPDLSLVSGLPVKILRTFTPQEDHVLSPGDMLYLPPQHAHDGVALEACTTYSIGFRAASAQELASPFLDFVSETITLDGRYADPDLLPTSEPARIGHRMQRRTAALLRRIRWDAATVARFLGSYLSEPKAAVVFDPPHPPSSRAAFAKRIRSKGLVLDRRTRLLYDDERFYVNGAEAHLPAQGAQSLRELANARRLSAGACAVLAGDTLTLLHAWYRDGFLTPGE
jgi:50S ribosomal protein L16 3-hydroxylase